jgi:hypothetical protein
MAFVQSVAAASSSVGVHVKRAAGLVARSIGFDASAVLPRIGQTIRRVSRSVGIAPDSGFHPGRYWPILLIAVALAESAHAPFMNGARAASKTPSPLPPKPPEKKTPDAPDKKHSDMHGPYYPDPILDKDKKKKESDDPFPDLKLLVDPVLFHGVDNDITLPGGDSIIDGGGGAVAPPNDIISIVHGGISGGGGSGGDADISGLIAENGTGVIATDVGPVYPSVHDGSGTVSVPEPGCCSILLFGTLLLGRRGIRSRL